MYDFPLVSDLDATSPDYAANLDAGIQRIERFSEEYDQKVLDLQRRRRSSVLRSVAALVDVTLADDLETFLQEQDDRPLHLTAEEGGILAACYGRDKAVFREAQDTQLKIFRAFRPEADKLIDERTYLRRALEDYTDAVAGLTEVEELHSFPSRLDSLHIYVVRDEGIYETHHNKVGTSNPEARLNPDLREEMFSTYALGNRLNDEARERGTMVCLVRNPCTSITVQDLAEQAQVAIHNRYQEHLRENFIGEVLANIREYS